MPEIQTLVVRIVSRCTTAGAAHQPSPIMTCPLRAQWLPGICPANSTEWDFALLLGDPAKAWCKTIMVWDDTSGQHVYHDWVRRRRTDPRLRERVALRSTV